MPRNATQPVDPGDAPLKRLGGGRWQTRDGRFTIEPQSGTWVVVDGEQSDDLGLPLVRGPFASLTAAKEAISTARISAPAASPLAERIERRRREPSGGRSSEPSDEGRSDARRAVRERRDRSAPVEEMTGDAAPERAEPTPEAPRRAPARADANRPAAGRAPARPSRSADRPGAAADERRDPGWLADLGPGERGRARRLIVRLTEDGTPDAEGLVRRDLVGGVPALAAHAIARRLAEVGGGAGPDDVAELLADGKDERLGVRWRLVDGDGRPIVLDSTSRRRR